MPADRAIIRVGFAALLCASCGGRTTGDAAPDAAAPATTGSGSAVGGSSGTQASSSTSVGGSGGATAGAGGTLAGSGGAPDASPCPIGCPDIGCAPGYVLVLEPGACCPVCKPDPVAQCRAGQKAYSDFHAMIFDKYESIGCNVQMDCTVVYEQNRCVDGCGTVVPARLARDFEQNLKSFADTNCATCGPLPVPPCPPPPFPDCLGGRCAPGGTPPP